MIGAGTVINPIIKVVTTIIILGAVYLFFVKPALDTTENISETVSESISGFDEFPDDIQNQIDDAFEGTGQGQQSKLMNCVGNAGQDTDKLQRCVERFGG